MENVKSTVKHTFATTTANYVYVEDGTPKTDTATVKGLFNGSRGEQSLKQAIRDETGVDGDLIIMEREETKAVYEMELDYFLAHAVKTELPSTPENV